MVEHNQWAVVLEYVCEGGGEKRKIGAGYKRPKRAATDIRKGLETIEGCDVVSRDLKARNPR